MSSLHRVYIVAALPAAREALRWALESEPDLTVAGEAAGAGELLFGAAGPRTDVVLLDLSRFGADGVAVTRALKATATAPAVILLVTDGDAATRRRYAQAGGDALVEKGAGWPALVGEIRRAVAGRR
ncbi:MAG TPA: response regulator [Chloroflexota bacterium]|nr:response regulator [Chloroflexota bacterium]